MGDNEMALLSQGCDFSRISADPMAPGSIFVNRVNLVKQNGGYRMRAVNLRDPINLPAWESHWQRIYNL